MKEIIINPVTRLEGHGKITIFLNDEGDVDEAYFQVPELRGFEKFCEGRRAEDLPIITTRICGVCPVAHHMAGAKALDAAFNVEPPEPAKKLRELMYCGYYLYDHTLHFYYLGGPDFVVGPHAPPEKRNILGVIEKAGLEIAKEVIKHRAYGQKITEIMGGKATHPVSACIPGGIARPISEEERREIERMVRSFIEFAKFSLKLFDDIVLKNTDYVSLIKSEPYTLKTYYMGTVDKNNKVNFYDGKVRVVDPEGKEFVKFSPGEYLDVIEEHVEPWTYVKLPFLKKVGWKGLVDGPESGLYRVGPLGRLNAADGMATPLAQAEYERMYATLGGKPVHNTLAYHWARLIELLYAAERALELVTDPEITSKNVRGKPGKPGEGVGIVEAARGTLIHHYQLDENALAKKVNLIVATVHNAPSICLSIRNAAKGLIKGGKVTDGILNMVEMAFRAYDPCFACATHFAVGQMPLEVEIYDSQKRLIQTLKR
ncbi:MAG: Ni/Fe hydrogenase subunit alpha [Nitrososphaerota archaeon]|nr:Ni/Fe hydrogenase subunit alpha [Candidatus Bathyarchaeota archaeon]MDW8023938.1 Ni/Fe hydrogenase subunit alpha [Nitrososphaerota archaeon]